VSFGRPEEIVEAINACRDGKCSSNILQAFYFTRKALLSQQAIDYPVFRIILFVLTLTWLFRYLPPGDM
jgi:hypothetical protein